MKQNYCIVYCSVPKDTEHGELISKELVINRLAACVSIINNITSTYIWSNNLETTSENLMVIKTKTSLITKVKEKIVELHPYSCPEIIVVSIIDGLGSYLKWIDSCLTN